MSMSTTTRETDLLARKSRNQYIFVIIGIVIFLALKFLLHPSDGGLTEKGVNTIAILVSVVFLWVTQDVVMPSILAIMALIATGTVGADYAWYVVFAQRACVMIVGTSIFMFALEETGCIRWCARWLLARKQLNGKPYWFILCFGLILVAIASIVGAPSATIVMTALAKELREEIGIEKAHKYNLGLGIITMQMAMIGEMLCPFGKVVPMLTLQLAQAQGLPMTMLNFFQLGWIYAVAGTVFAMLSIRFVLRPSTAEYMLYDNEVAREKLRREPLTRRGKILVVMFILYAPYIFLPEFNSFMSMFGYGCVVFTPAILGWLIHVDHEPIINVPKALPRVSWGVVIFVGTIMLLAELCTSSDTGIVTWLVSNLAPMLGGIPTFLLMGVTIILSVLATNFASNAVVLVVALLSTFAVLNASGTLSTSMLMSYAVVLCFASITAFLTPPGATSTALVMSDQDTGTNVRNCFSTNLAMMIIMALFGWLILLPLGGVIFS